MTDLPSRGLIITVGCPGAGKSTWAENHLASETLRLERDRFRECLFGSRRAYHDSAFSREERSAVITEAMLAAMRNWPIRRWAVTDTGLRKDAILPFLDHCIFLDPLLRVTLVVFPRSADYLHYVNKTRPVQHRIPTEILAEQIELFNDPAAWWRHCSIPRIEVPSC